MNWFLRLFRPRIVDRPILRPEEIRRALAAEIEGIPVFEAVICVLEAHRRNYQTDSYGKNDPDNRARLDGCQEALDELRRELFSERMNGRAENPSN